MQDLGIPLGSSIYHRVITYLRPVVYCQSPLPKGWREGRAIIVGTCCQRTTEPPQAAVLVVSPIEEDRASLQSILNPPGWKLYEAVHLTEAMAILRDERIPVVLCERELLVGDWTALLDAVQLLPRPPYLIVTSRQADNRLWAAVMDFGGYDVLAAPFNAAEVVRVTRSAWLGWNRRWNRASLRTDAAVA